MGSGVGEAITRAAELALETRTPLLDDRRLGRSAHAGGLRLAHADGEDEPGDRTPPRGRRPVRLPAHRPDLRRRERLVRHARRRPRSPSRELHRLRRSEGDRADDPPAAAGRVPDGRVPARARHARPRRAAGEPASDARGSCSSSTRSRRAATATRTRSANGFRTATARADHRPGASSPGVPAWDVVQLARHIDRPNTLEYIGYVFDDFQELHGDRLFERGRCRSSAASPGSATSPSWSSATRRGTRRAR